MVLTQELFFTAYQLHPTLIRPSLSSSGRKRMRVPVLVMRIKHKWGVLERLINHHLLENKIKRLQHKRPLIVLYPSPSDVRALYPGLANVPTLSRFLSALTNNSWDATRLSLIWPPRLRFLFITAIRITTIFIFSAHYIFLSRRLIRSWLFSVSAQIRRFISIFCEAPYFSKRILERS